MSERSASPFSGAPPSSRAPRRRRYPGSFPSRTGSPDDMSEEAFDDDVHPFEFSQDVMSLPDRSRVVSGPAALHEGTSRLARQNHGRQLEKSRLGPDDWEGLRQAQLQMSENIWNKMLTLEETDSNIRQFERATDVRRWMTFRGGHPMPEDQEIAPGVQIRVGLIFLPGADKAQVAKREQEGMARHLPDQKHALWRITTAGSLLRDWQVSADLTHTQTDLTNQIVAKAQRRRKRELKSGLGEQQRLDLWPSQKRINQDERGLTKTKDKPPTVTVTSEGVHIVHDLRGGDWDVECLLIEVDEPSLIRLITNYRYFISHVPDMSFAETKKMLDVMIEDARRLYVRSPILFRMGTRQHIINAKHIRYGIDHSPMFRTLTTSKGIKEIISLGAAYYNSLDPTGTKDTTQDLMRPKFLQMIVLLLSLVNDDDLKDIADFLQSTYGLKAERHHLEMVFLRVLPLTSINSKVFLEALLLTIEGRPFPSIKDADQHMDYFWKVFLKNRLDEGYFLPGTVTALGQSERSWSVKWPKEKGFNSSIVFNDLQYTGSSLRAMNEIPALEIHLEDTVEDVTVMLTNGDKYTIDTVDVEPITLLSPGRYPIVEAKEGGKQYELFVHEMLITAEISEAVSTTNQVIDMYNRWVYANQTNQTNTGRVLSMPFRQKKEDLQIYNNIPGCGRITRNTCTLRNDKLAEGYKLAGRMISARDAARFIYRDVNSVREVLHELQRRVGTLFTSKKFNRKDLQHTVDGVMQQVLAAEEIHKQIQVSQPISNEPIAQVLPSAGMEHQREKNWFDYSATLDEADGMLHVQAQRVTVNTVLWRSDSLIEIAFTELPSLFYATPLQPVLESQRDDEILAGDTVVLVGGYVAVAEIAEDGPDGMPSYYMANCLRITAVEAQNRPRRGANRMQREDQTTLTRFR